MLNYNTLSLFEINQLSSEKKNTLYQKLEQIYSELDSDLKKIDNPCTGCGMCCNFEKAEHRLYICSLEFLYLEDKYSKIITEADICPFLVNSQCSVRDRRMIGCRTYFRLHSEKDRQHAESLYEIYLKKLKKLYLEEKITWEYRDFMGYLK